MSKFKVGDKVKQSIYSHIKGVGVVVGYWEGVYYPYYVKFDTPSKLYEKFGVEGLWVLAEAELELVE